MEEMMARESVLEQNKERRLVESALTANLQNRDMEAARAVLKNASPAVRSINLYGKIDSPEKIAILDSLNENVHSLILGGASFPNTKQDLENLCKVLQEKNISELTLLDTELTPEALTGLSSLPLSVWNLHLEKCRIATSEAVTTICKVLEGKNVSTLALGFNDFRKPETLAAFTGLPDTVVKLDVVSCHIHSPEAISTFSKVLQTKPDLVSIDFHANGTEFGLNGSRVERLLNLALPELQDLLASNPHIQDFRMSEGSDLALEPSRTITGNIKKKHQTLLSLMLAQVERHEAAHAASSSSGAASSVPVEPEEDSHVGKWTRRYEALKDDSERCIIS
jgi:hypothetical protein